MKEPPGSKQLTPLFTKVPLNCVRDVIVPVRVTDPPDPEKVTVIFVADTDPLMFKNPSRQGWLSVWIPVPMRPAGKLTSVIQPPKESLPLSETS
jgi:hypothetical protein